MKVFYDTEFIEDGRTIDLISIGLVAEDGREYYAVNRNAPWRRIAKDEWLREHVVRSLPHIHGDGRNYLARNNVLALNFYHPTMRTLNEIAQDLRGDFFAITPEPDLWAWYCAYDHVVLAQLFGRMIDLPSYIPMWTNDLRQEVERLGNPDMPAQEGSAHNALADARHVKVMYDYCQALGEQK